VCTWKVQVCSADIGALGSPAIHITAHTRPVMMLAELLQHTFCMQRGALNVPCRTAYSATPAALLTACESATRGLEHYLGGGWKASETRFLDSNGMARRSSRVAVMSRSGKSKSSDMMGSSRWSSAIYNVETCGSTVKVWAPRGSMSLAALSN